MNTRDKQKFLCMLYPEEKVYRLADEAVDYLYNKSQPKTVTIASLENKPVGSYMIDSLDGPVPAFEWRNKGVKDCVTILTDSTTITASVDHFFEMDDNKWKYAGYIFPGEHIKTKNGTTQVLSVEPAGEQVVYDFHINHKNHRYLTNNLSSHNSGAGKSLFLANLGVNWALLGMNVLYLTFELSENLVSMRVDSMVTGISTKDVFKSIDDVVLKVKMIGKKSGAFQVKYMPSGKNANDIRSFLKEYEIKTGRRVDVLLIDYLDLMMPVGVKISPSDLFVKDKYVSEELRNLAMELNTVFVTASQLNRCLTLDTEVEIKDKGRVKISDVEVNDLILTNTGYNTVVNKFPVTKQKVYQIKTRSGKIIRCSAEHIFPTAGGEKKISTGLSVGDILYQKR
jgi:hypothetical protein